MPDLPLFATPLAMYELPDMEDLNRDLATRLVAESQAKPSVSRSNVGSWHSPSDLALRPQSCYRTLIQHILSRVRETVDKQALERGTTLPPLRMGAQAWAMVMGNGSYTVPHDHADAHWSTVYYADAGDADENAYPDSGLLAFVDPRHGARPMPGLDLVGTTFTAKARSGRLYVFPSWLFHYVHPYRGLRPRVSISCNITFEVLRSSSSGM